MIFFKKKIIMNPQFIIHYGRNEDKTLNHFKMQFFFNWIKWFPFYYKLLFFKNMLQKCSWDNLQKFMLCVSLCLIDWFILFYFCIVLLFFLFRGFTEVIYYWWWLNCLHQSPVESITKYGRLNWLLQWMLMYFCAWILLLEKSNFNTVF